MILVRVAMPIERITVSCLEELLAKVGEWKSKADKIYLFFCGDRDEATGESWCSDCVKGVQWRLEYLCPSCLCTSQCVAGQ